MAKHTPGPWITLAAISEDRFWTQAYENGQHISIAEINCKLPNADANARLIAAAPELLEIIEALKVWYAAATDGKHRNEGPSPYALLFDDDRNLYEHIHDVVAKAEE